MKLGWGREIARRVMSRSRGIDEMGKPERGQGGTIMTSKDVLMGGPCLHRNMAAVCAECAECGTTRRLKCGGGWRAGRSRPSHRGDAAVLRGADGQATKRGKGQEATVTQASSSPWPLSTPNLSRYGSDSTESTESTQPSQTQPGLGPQREGICAQATCGWLRAYAILGGGDAC